MMDQRIKDSVGMAVLGFCTGFFTCGGILAWVQGRTLEASVWTVATLIFFILLGFAFKAVIKSG